MNKATDNRDTEFKLRVEQAAEIASENSEIDTTVGGGLHPVTSALWTYLLSIQQAIGVRGNLMEVGVFKGWGLFIPGRYCGPKEALHLLDISRGNLDQSRRFVLDRNLVQPEQIVELEGDTLTL